MPYRAWYNKTSLPTAMQLDWPNFGCLQLAAVCLETEASKGASSGTGAVKRPVKPCKTKDLVPFSTSKGTLFGTFWFLAKGVIHMPIVRSAFCPKRFNRTPATSRTDSAMPPPWPPPNTVAWLRYAQVFIARFQCTRQEEVHKRYTRLRIGS